MLKLTLVTGGACAICWDDIRCLKEDVGTINGNYNKSFTVVSLKSGAGFNVRDTIDDILDKIEKEKLK